MTAPIIATEHVFKMEDESQKNEIQIWRKHKVTEDHLTDTILAFQGDSQLILHCPLLLQKSKSASEENMRVSRQMYKRNRPGRSATTPWISLALLLIAVPIVDANNACRLRTSMYTVTYDNCEPKTVEVNVCLGHCPSYATIDPYNPSVIQKSCSCCQATGFADSRVALRCPSSNGFTGTVFHVKVPTGCLCRPCSPAPVI